MSLPSVDRRTDVNNRMKRSIASAVPAAAVAAVFVWAAASTLQPPSGPGRTSGRRPGARGTFRFGHAKPSRRGRPAVSLPQEALTTTATVTGSTASLSALVSPLGLLVADTELVYGPTLYGFDVEQFVSERGGYLASYTEVVNGETLTGAELVNAVAEDYSVGPRVLLALIEAHSGWVTQPRPDPGLAPLDQPVAALGDALAMAADELNSGYYGYKYDDRRQITLADGSSLLIPDTNPGTFAVLAATWRGATWHTWGGMEGPSRFSVAWSALFGDPYDMVVTEAVPSELRYVDLELPIEEGLMWYLTAGPHSPRGAGAARAAIDLSPPPGG